MSQPEDFLPVIIGGDHAITAPAVRAYCGAHPDQQVGLIHFDAHNDVRVMDHGPTNGTPIRGILESGVRVRGSNLVQFGIHGFMNASYYKRWVEGQGGTIFTARAIRQQGIEPMVAAALEIAGRDTDAIYVTVDIDVLEVGYAPGTAAATADGLSPTDLLEALFVLGQDPRVMAIDFVELDPTRDVADITIRTFGSAILTFLAGYFLRRHDGWRGYDQRRSSISQGRTTIPMARCRPSTGAGEPDLQAPTNAMTFVAPGSVTRRQFGLFRRDMTPSRRRAASTLSARFGRTVRLYVGPDVGRGPSGRLPVRARGRHPCVQADQRAASCDPVTPCSSDVAVMPGLVAVARHVTLASGIGEDEAILPRVAHEPRARIGLGPVLPSPRRRPA